jgi:hypothetical protein
MRRHALRFVSATRGQQPASSDGTRRDGTRSGGGALGARAGRWKWVGGPAQGYSAERLVGQNS